jgi:hypothetical protein
MRYCSLTVYVGKGTVLFSCVKGNFYRYGVRSGKLHGSKDQEDASQETRKAMIGV